MRAQAVLAAALLALLALGAVSPPSAAQGTPANCSVANLNNWWGYQYDQRVRTTWDGYSSQSRGVCVMRDAQTPIPAECRFSVQAPWWVASGSPPSPPLCWWGTPATPKVVVTAPAGCTATALGARASYSDPAVKALWDYYSSQTKGVCEAFGAAPSGCRFTVQEAATKWLCWWPAKGGSALRQVLDRSAYEELARSAMDVAEICDLVGSGDQVVEFRVGDERVQVQLDDCKVVDIQWLTAPDGCRDVDPSRYASLVGQAALDAGLANAADVCLLPRSPTQGECTSSIVVGPSSHLCFFGRKTGGATRASAILLPPLASVSAAVTGKVGFTISADRSAVRAVLNSVEPGETVRKLVCDGNIVMNAADRADQLKLRVALGTFIGDQACKGVDGPSMADAAFQQEHGIIAWDSSIGLNYIGLSPDGLQVFNPDGAGLGFLPGSLLPPGSDPLAPPTLPPDAGNHILSQSPTIIADGLGYSVNNAIIGNHDGLVTFAAILAGQDTETVTDWAFHESEDPRNWEMPPGMLGSVLVPAFPADGGTVLVGPRGVVPLDTFEDTSDDPPESILDDIEECRVICGAAPGSQVFGQGSPYLGGAAAGHSAASAMQRAGLVMA